MLFDVLEKKIILQNEKRKTQHNFFLFFKKTAAPQKLISFFMLVSLFFHITQRPHTVARKIAIYLFLLDDLCVFFQHTNGDKKMSEKILGIWQFFFSSEIRRDREKHGQCFGPEAKVEGESFVGMGRDDWRCS